MSGRRPPNHPKLAEKIIMDALDERGIKFVFEGQHCGRAAHLLQKGLDFYLPDFGIYIEVKDFWSERIAGQMKRDENIICIQGRKAAQVFSGWLAGSFSSDGLEQRPSRPQVEGSSPSMIANPSVSATAGKVDDE